MTAGLCNTSSLAQHRVSGRPRCLANGMRQGSSCPVLTCHSSLRACEHTYIPAHDRSLVGIGMDLTTTKVATEATSVQEMSLTLYSIASLSTIIAGLLSMAGLGWFWRKKPLSPNPNGTTFVGSQIGDKSVINYCYTDMPWKLMAFDVYYFFVFIWALPHILLPITPADSGDLAELSFTRGNLFCIAIHFVLCVLQLGFIVSLPLMVLLPIWTAVLAIASFFVVNHGLCKLINGKVVEYHSDPKYAPALPEHAHEQWIFINGVAVGYVLQRSLVEFQTNMSTESTGCRIT